MTTKFSLYAKTIAAASLLVALLTIFYKHFTANDSLLAATSCGKNIDYSINHQPIFNSEGINNIALVMMTKDEEDIIYQNLVWHFSLGFRKFVIINNNSSDQTLSRILKFKEQTSKFAVIFIIEDPIVEHIQSRLITSAYKLAGAVWPEVDWIFATDSDEFWLPDIDLNIILADIPSRVDILHTSCLSYSPSDDYYDCEDEAFYGKIHYRTKNFYKSKIALRSKKDIIIAQGNHEASYDYMHKEWWQKIIFKYFYSLNYISGDSVGLHMREFPTRSVEQMHKKLFNGMRANLAAKEKKIIKDDVALYWDSYRETLKEYKDLAGHVRFEAEILSSQDGILDVFPYREAQIIFERIINKIK